VGYKTINYALVDLKNDELELVMKKRVFNIKLPDANDPNLKMQLPPPPPPNDMEKRDNILKVFENMPYYNNGGMSRLALDIKKEVDWVLDKTKDRGEAVVGFTVGANGKIINPHIRKSADSKMLDESAVKIVAKLDNWWAGMQRDKRVPVDLTVPVMFE
jgi:TonB family protein